MIEREEKKMKTITRNVTMTVVTIATYNEETEEAVKTTSMIIGKKTVPAIKKLLKSNQMLLNYEYQEIKFSMPLEKFVENATQVQE